MVHAPRLALVLSTALAALALAPRPAGASEPWYERQRCEAALTAVLDARFDEAESKLSTLEASRDPDDQACGVWIRVLMAEIQLGVGGRLPALLQNREARLKRMFAFAKAHATYGRRFADLEIEARMRRVRLVIEAGDRTEGLAEAKRAKAMIEAQRGEPTPTIQFAAAVMNLAFAYEAWPIRTVLTLAGLKGDVEVGKKNLMPLIEGNTIYRYEALYVARHFAETEPTGVLGNAVPYSKLLSEKFPGNPQFAFDHAVDLKDAKRCADALAFSSPVRAKLDQTPTLWSNVIRAKIFWISSRCALETGDKAEAARLLKLARRESFPDLEPKLGEIEAKL